MSLELCKMLGAWVSLGVTLGSLGVHLWLLYCLVKYLDKIK